MADRKVLFRSGANVNEASPSADRVRAIGMLSGTTTVALEQSGGANVSLSASDFTVSSGINILPAADSNANLAATGTRFAEAFVDKVTTEEIEDTAGSLVIDSIDGTTGTIAFTNSGAGNLTGTWGTDDSANDTLDLYGDVTVGGTTARNMVIKGNLTVEGTTTSIGGENTLIADNFQVLNSAYTADTAQNVGHVYNVNPEATSFSISSIASDVITVASGDPSAVLSVTDFIIIAGANTTSNDGVYEVGAVDSTTITIDTTPTEDFVQNSLTDDATAGGTVVGTELCVQRVNTSGTLQFGTGTAAGITFSDVQVGPTATTLDAAYTNGRDVTMDLGHINFDGDASTTGGTFDINPNVLAETSPQIDITFASGNYTGTVPGLLIDYATTTSITNGSDVVAIDLNGQSNSGAGDTVALSIDSAFDQGIENASSHVQSGSFAMSGSGTFDFGSSGAVTSTGNPTFNFGSSQADFDGNVNASAGVDIDADSAALTIGAGGDINFVHNGTNSVLTSATGDLILDNTNTTGSTIIRLGTDTAATDFQVQNDSATALLTITGATSSATWGVNVQFNANVTLGNAATDTVTFTADVNSDILPDDNATRDLGASGASWAEIWMDSVELGSSSASDGASVIGYDSSSNAQTSATDVAGALDDLGTAIGDIDQIVVEFTAGANIDSGTAVRVSANDTAIMAIATSEAAARVVGVAEAAITSSQTGDISVGYGSLIETMRLEDALTPGFNDEVFLSDTDSGRGTNVAPTASGSVVKKIGIIKDDSAYVTVSNPFVEMLLQPETGTLIA